MSLTQRAKMEVLRTSIRKVTRLLTKSKLPVIMAGTSAKVTYGEDGKPLAIYLPSLPDNASEEVIDAIQGFVDHEVAHVLFSDFDVLVQGKTLGIPMLLNAAEDTFIESERGICGVYEGSKRNVARMRDLFIDRFIEPRVKELQEQGVTDPQAWWATLGVCAIRAWAGHVEFQLYMDDKWGLLGDIPALAEKKGVPEALQSITCSKESLKAAIRISHVVEEAKNPPKDEEDEKPTPPEEDKDDTDDSEDDTKDDTKDDTDETDETDETDKSEDKADDEGDSGEEQEGDGDGENSQEEDGDEGEPGDGSNPGDSEIEEESDGEGTSPGDDGDEDSDEAKPDDPEFEEEDTPPPGFNDDDYKGVEDYLENVIDEAAKQYADSSSYLPYSRDADIIEPLPDEEVEPGTVEAFEDDIKKHIAPIQRALANAFESKNKRFQVHGKREGRLSTPSLHRLVTNDDRVYYQNKDIRTRESAVQLVIDISGSMGGLKAQLAGQVGWALAEVLDRLNVSSEVICFTQYPHYWGGPHRDNPAYAEVDKSSDREFSRYGPIWMPILKSWDEQHFTQKHKRAFTRLGKSMLPMMGNVDGESLQYAGLRLAARPEPGKVMIVLSDGQPAGDSGDRRLSAHLKDVVRDLSKADISMVGIGILDGSVKHYYPKHVVVNKLEDLAGTVIGQVRAALLKD